MRSNFSALVGGWDDLLASNVVDIREIVARGGKQGESLPGVKTARNPRGWLEQEDVDRVVGSGCEPREQKLEQRCALQQGGVWP